MQYPFHSSNVMLHFGLKLLIQCITSKEISVMSGLVTDNCYLRYIWGTLTNFEAWVGLGDIVHLARTLISFNS